MSRAVLLRIVAICSLAAPSSVWAQVAIEMPACDRLLDGGYDALPTSAKQARLVQYANCWKRRADVSVNRNYSDIEIDKLVNEDLASLARQQQQKLRYLGDKFDSFVNAAPDQSIKDYEATKSIGTVRAVEGTARIVGGGEARDAVVGAPIHLGDTVRTDPGAVVDIAFNDATSLSVAGGSTLVVDRNVYDPDAPDAEYSFLNGLFRYVSGLVGKQEPDEQQPDKPIKILYGNIGIRG